MSLIYKTNLIFEYYFLKGSTARRHVITITLFFILHYYFEMKFHLYLFFNTRIIWIREKKKHQKGVKITYKKHRRKQNDE